MHLVNYLHQQCGRFGDRFKQKLRIIQLNETVELFSLVVGVSLLIMFWMYLRKNKILFRLDLSTYALDHVISIHVLIIYIFTMYLKPAFKCGCHMSHREVLQSFQYKMI